LFTEIASENNTKVSKIPLLHEPAVSKTFNLVLSGVPQESDRRPCIKHLEQSDPKERNTEFKDVEDSLNGKLHLIQALCPNRKEKGSRRKHHFIVPQV
jgi:hypothetical protein